VKLFNTCGPQPVKMWAFLKNQQVASGLTKKTTTKHTKKDEYKDYEAKKKTEMETFQKYLARLNIVKTKFIMSTSILSNIEIFNF
jgi:hypothetical protein